MPFHALGLGALAFFKAHAGSVAVSEGVKYGAGHLSTTAAHNAAMHIGSSGAQQLLNAKTTSDVLQATSTGILAADVHDKARPTVTKAVNFIKQKVDGNKGGRD